MIITPHPFGRMANRLVLASNWIAHVEETADRYLHLRFAEYARYFEGTKGGLVLQYGSSRYTPRRYRKNFGVLNIRHLDASSTAKQLDSQEFARLQASAKYLFAIGWDFRTSEEVMKRHRGNVVAFFKPVARHIGNIERCIEAARTGADHLIGIHIRQTDYKAFKGGQWFYPQSVFRRIMEEVQAQLPGQCRFLVCSDAPLDMMGFSGLDICKAPGHIVEDCYSLARCDFILGPPSTYSLWASFYGQVPLLRITAPDQTVQLDKAVTRIRP